MMQEPPPPPGFVPEGSAPPQPMGMQAQQPPQIQARPQGNLTAEALFPALVHQESRGRAGAVGPMTRYGQALGRTQMLPATAREMAARVGVPYDESLLRGTSPEAAAYQDRLGMAYLQEGFDRTGNAREALMYYHGGPDRRLWGPKTRAYADAILSNAGQGGAQPQMMADMPPPPPGFVAEGESPPQMYNGRPVEISVSDPIQFETNGVYDPSAMTPEQIQGLRRGDRVQTAENGVVTLRGRPYRSEGRAGDVLDSGLRLRQENNFDRMGAFTSGLVEQVPFLDEAANAVTAGLNGQTFSQARDDYRNRQQILNEQYRGERNAGGIAGFATSLAAPGGGWVEGANGLAKVGRAAALGGAYGALFGAGNTDGSLTDRLQAASIQAPIGALTGGLFQRGSDMLGAAAAASRANPSAARQLSAAGVNLTPGQMIGGAARRIEDGLQSVPIMGDAIRDARRRGLETFNAAAINEAVKPVGSVANVGRQGIGEAGRVVSGAYDQALTGVQVPRTGQFDAAVTALARQNPLPPQMQGDFNAILGNTLQQFGQGVDGPGYKVIDSQLSSAIRSAQNGSATDPAKRLLAEKLMGLREAFQGNLEAVNPQAFAAVRQADTANAGLARIRDAGQSSGTAARDGIFTPGDLNRAVRNGDSSAGNRQYAQGDALLQRLSDSASSVLPNVVPDSGTPFRSMAALLTPGAAAAGAGAVGVPIVGPAAVATGVGLFGGGALYGKGVQSAINRAYRATTPGAARQALSDLQAAAAKSPVLQPVYEALQSALRPLLLGGQTPAPTPAQ